MNCACVKAGRPCSNCLPSRKKQCMNHAVVGSVDWTSTDLSSMEVVTGLDNDLVDDLDISSEPAEAGLIVSCVGPHQPSPSNGNAELESPCFPTFFPMANAVFSCGIHESETFTCIITAAYA